MGAIWSQVEGAERSDRGVKSVGFFLCLHEQKGRRDSGCCGVKNLLDSLMKRFPKQAVRPLGLAKYHCRGG